MTKLKAERINGHRYYLLDDGWIAVDAEGRVSAKCSVKKEREAIGFLVEEIYRQNRMKALVRDGYRCVLCGSGYATQADHIVSRGMAGSKRNDRLDNLRTLCCDCHVERHGG